jgi:sec-independent protein translocase protein TatA
MYTGVLLEFLNMGGSEIMLIMLVVLLLFGGKKLPELARGLGKGIRDFKDASEGVKREIHRNINAVDIDEELNADRNTTTAKTATETLEEQMYPKTEVKEPINLTKEETVPVHQEATVVPSQTAASLPAETPETEKNKI